MSAAASRAARLVLCLAPPLASCGGSATPDPRAPMIVRTDLALLRQRIRVPEAVTSATWTVLPVGGAGDAVPGPTDTRLWAYLRADGGGFGAEGAPGAVLVPEAVAAAILPPELLAGTEREGDARRVEGASFDPAALDRGVYRGVHAVRAGGGLLAVLQTQ